MPFGLVRHRPNPTTALGGYMLACLAAGVTMHLYLTVGSGGFFGSAGFAVVSTIGFWLTMTAFTMALALPGFLLASLAAYFLPIGHLVTAILAGALNTWLGLALLSLSTPPFHPFISLFMIPGAMGGGVYWWVTRPRQVLS